MDAITVLNDKRRVKKKKGILLKIATLAAASIVAVPFASLATSEDAFASTGGKSANDAINWAKSMLGKGIDYDGAYGNQCVDLIKAYYVYLGNRAVLGNGVNYNSNSLPSGWTRIKGATPKKGDVLVYSGGYGGYGHVAIYESNTSSYHQNFNGHSYVEKVGTKYNAISGITYWGVVRPDFATSSTSNTAKTVVKSASTKNGLYVTGGVWKYYKNGKVDTSYTGLALNPSNGKWYFVRKGIYDNKYTGICKNGSNGKWYYVKNGAWNESYTGLAYNSFTGKWSYVKKGRYDNTYTGLAFNASNGRWYYVKNGIWNESYNGLALNGSNGKWYYVKRGRYDNTYTGLALNASNGKWYYVKKGSYDNTYTGLAKNGDNGRWYYVSRGSWLYTYNGKVKYNGKTYTVKNGRLVGSI